MTVNFYKYHGAGNDFVVIDNRLNTFFPAPELVNRLCHRRFGIGADGLLLLETSGTHDFAMRYFNADGHEGSMCGNGGRCIAAFAYQQMNLKEKITFMAVDGLHRAEILCIADGVAQVRLKMADVERVEPGDGYYFIDTGSPHYVAFVENADILDVATLGKEIRYSPLFPHGTNVDFVEIRQGKLFVRTYERGVEDETLSCGTGVTASAIAASFVLPQLSYEINTRGGNLKVSFAKDKEKFVDVWLEGPAACVFSGQITL